MDKDRRADKTVRAEGTARWIRLAVVSAWRWSQWLEVVLKDREWEEAISLSNCLEGHRKNMGGVG